MKNQITEMLALQDSMNTQVHPNWRAQSFEWYRAVWVESAELLDHYGWKWWKHQTPDMPQIHLELVDIWHFGLSMLLQERSDTDAIADQITAEFSESLPEHGDFKILLEAFVAVTLAQKNFNVLLFRQLMAAVDLDFEQLHKMYVSKNVLNRFRQDKGYQQGTYIKVWHGREDNEHLSDIIELSSSAPSGQLFQWIYDQLAERYATL
jgi:dimeric dUTPase (all-alpha-NTP-PPase superfamily)